MPDHCLRLATVRELVLVSFLIFTQKTSYEMLMIFVGSVFFIQAEDGILDAHESRGFGYVYKRQKYMHVFHTPA